MSIEHDVMKAYLEGKTDSGIAETVPWSRSKVGRWLRAQGLPANSRGWLRKSPTEATCPSCGVTQLIEKYPLNHKGTPYETRLRICRTCRTAQIRDNLRSDETVFLRERYRQIRVRVPKEEWGSMISRDEFIAQFSSQEGRCFYTDVPLTPRPTGRHDMISVDRVDCTGGYTPGNVVFCANRINTMKSDMTKEEMSVWVPTWYERAARFAGW